MFHGGKDKKKTLHGGRIFVQSRYKNWWKESIY